MLKNPHSAQGTARRVSTILGLLPASKLKNWLLSKAGHDVHPTAHIGSVVILGSTRLQIREAAHIGSLNVFRDLSSLFLGEHARIGQLNWVTAAPALVRASTSKVAGQLQLDDDSSITNRHYLDVAGGLHLEPFALMAGVRSTVLTHEIDVAESRQTTKAIVVGRSTLVSSNACLTAGVVVPANSVIAMGAVAVRAVDMTQSGLYAGVPARFVKPTPAGTETFFSRTEQWVHP